MPMHEYDGGDRATRAARSSRTRANRSRARNRSTGTVLGRRARRARGPDASSPPRASAGRRRCASGPRCSPRPRSPPTTRRRSRSCPARRRRRASCSTCVVGASVDDRGGLDRRRRRDLGREPGAARGSPTWPGFRRTPAGCFVSRWLGREPVGARWRARHAAAERRGAPARVADRGRATRAHSSVASAAARVMDVDVLDRAPTTSAGG